MKFLVPLRTGYSDSGKVGHFCCRWNIYILSSEFAVILMSASLCATGGKLDCVVAAARKQNGTRAAYYFTDAIGRRPPQLAEADVRRSNRSSHVDP